MLRFIIASWLHFIPSWPAVCKEEEVEEEGLPQSWPALGKEEEVGKGLLQSSWPAVGKEEEEEGSLRSWPAVVKEEEEEELLQSWPAVTYIWIGGEEVRSYSPEISVK